MLLDISIINYFDKGLSWETFVQGFFITNIFIVAFLFLMYLMPQYHVSDESFLGFYFRETENKVRKYFNNLSDDTNKLANLFLKFIQVISLSSIMIILSFIIGIIFSNVSDTFMDQDNTFHLGMKKNWTT